MIRRRDPLADPAPLVRRLYRYVAYVIGDGPEAQDVTSEAFERALRYRETYDPKQGAPATWLIGIARRCLSDRAGRSEPEPVSGPPLEQPDPGTDLAEEVSLRLTVRDVVERLSERDRELVALRYGADLTAREIGQLLGMRTNAAEVALHRLNARLRSELGDALGRSDRSTAEREIARKGLDARAGI